MIIDIDGCICEDIKNEEPDRMKDARVIKGAVEKINRWYSEGHYICFFTSRTEEHKKITQDWLKKNGFKFHQIIFNKPRGGNYHYIDNLPIRATRFNGKFSDFVKIRKDILVFKDEDN